MEWFFGGKVDSFHVVPNCFRTPILNFLFFMLLVNLSQVLRNFFFTIVRSVLPIFGINKKYLTNFNFEFSFFRLFFDAQSDFLKIKTLPRVRRARALGRSCRFFGIELLKVYLIGRNVTLFENRKNMRNHSTILLMGGRPAGLFIHTFPSRATSLYLL